MAYEVDAELLSDWRNEELNPHHYAYFACASLANWVEADGDLRNGRLHQHLTEQLAYWETDLRDRDRTQAKAHYMDLHLLSFAGRTVFRKHGLVERQLRRELRRLSDDPNQIVGTQYLFYMAAVLLERDFEVSFVPEERDARTPDLEARKAGRHVFIEANAKQPYRPPMAPGEVQRALQTAIDEKKLKFADPRFSPGMLVVDVTMQYTVPNETGLVRLVKWHSDALSQQDGANVVRLERDPGWSSRPENTGNIVSYLLDAFASIDRTRYHVQQALLTITRDAWYSGNEMTVPTAHLLVLERGAESNALFEITKLAYVL
jgi:hypothetical protein